MFLCGGADSLRRDTLRDYLLQRTTTIDVFYAEAVWDHIAADSARSALQMESDLAALADIVAIIVESPGTFAELGAFSLADPLRKKLLPILDSQYRGQSSFIATGPIGWVETDSDFAPAIYAPLNRILEAIDQVEERLGRIPKPKSIRVNDLAKHPKQLLFFLADLVAVTWPTTFENLTDLLNSVAPSILESPNDLRTLLGLAVALNLLKVDNICNDRYYSPALPDAVGRPFHRKRFLDLPAQRADHVSTLLAIPTASEALDQARGAL